MPMARRSRASKKPPFQTELTRQSVRATVLKKKLEAGEALAPAEDALPTHDVLLREDAFLKCYFENGFNGKRAVLDCGAFKPGSDKSAEVQAAVILSRPRVQTRINVFKAKYGLRFGVTNDKIEQRLALQAFANMSDYVAVQKDGSVVTDLTCLEDPEIGRHHGAAIKEIEVETYVEGYEDDERTIPINVKRTKIKLYDSLRALEALARVRQLPGYTNQPQGAMFNVQNMQVVYNTIEQKLLEESKQ